MTREETIAQIVADICGPECPTSTRDLVIRPIVEKTYDMIFDRGDISSRSEEWRPCTCGEGSRGYCLCDEAPSLGGTP